MEWNTGIDPNRTNSLTVIPPSFKTGPEPMVRLVRFWPDHFLLGAFPLLVNAWDWHLQQNRSN